MKLRRLSLVSIAGCLLGLAILMLMGIFSLSQMQHRQDEIDSLMALQGRIDNFSVASDNLLLQGADPELWTAYRADAATIQARLGSLVEDHPGAQRAIRHVDYIVAEVGRFTVPQADSPSVTTEERPSVGPLALPLRSQIVMSQVAGYGIALDTALLEVVSQRHQSIANANWWLAIGLASAAGLFGALCVAACGVIFRRINGPLSALSLATRRMEAGEHDARVPVAGLDEFADLSRTFNRMLDQQDSMVETLSGALATRRVLINSLPAHIALLDGDGKILEVNDQWRHFATNNDFRDASFGVGSNYLAICRAADGDCAEEALEAANGLQAVLDGEQETFALEYPCHSPDQPHWFRMMASRLAPGDETEGFLGPW
jgi:HAMP domain-containing protein